MERLKLYVVDEQYVQYLHGHDSRVMFWSSPHYKVPRKYIGVVLKINGFEYFAPLSSPKDSDYYYQSGKKKVRKNTIPIVRLVTDKGKLLGKIKLGNMIPVRSDCLELYDFTTEPDKRYVDLVKDEMICIRKSRAEIQKNAKILYSQKINGYEGIGYLSSIVDFGLLEQACKAYRAK